MLGKKYLLSYGSFLFSIGIKFVTGMIFPIFLYTNFLLLKKKHINWQRIHVFNLLLLTIGVFIEANQSGNFQPWYILVPLFYAVFLSNKYYVVVPSIIISVMSLGMYVPYLYLGNWNPPVPSILHAILYVSFGISFFTVLFVYFSCIIFRRNKRSKK